MLFGKVDSAATVGIMLPVHTIAHALQSSLLTLDIM